MIPKDGTDELLVFTAISTPATRFGAPCQSGTKSSHNNFMGQFGNIEWKGEDKIRQVTAEELQAQVRADKAYPKAIKNSDKQNVQIDYDKAQYQVTTRWIPGYSELCKQYSDNPTFNNRLLNTEFGLTYDQTAAKRLQDSSISSITYTS